MELAFERGSADRPRGHAILYFQTAESGALLATYLVLAPITFDIAKYIPPMFAGGIDLGKFAGHSPLALPPLPEEVAGLALLEQLADLRDDDLVDGGTVSGGPERLFQAVAEAMQEYVRLYDAGTAPRLQEAPAPPADESLDVDAVVYELMTDQVRVSELAKLTGKLRYAVEVADARLLEEAVAEVRRLARYLPPSYRIEDYLRVATVAGERAGRLTALYIERCYKLAAEDYTEVARIERQIAAAEAEPLT
ncbi:MAG: hypothetical protein K6U89_08295 [Chloroflexi bacterium]|nr:hypothetical protein [Chloroflexota bacterium]